MNKRVAVLLVALVFVVAACGSSGGDDSSTKTTTGDKTSDAGGSGGGCKGFSAGKDGVLQTFCDGTAEVTITIDGKSHNISGGSCVTAAGQFTLNAGVTAGQDFKGDLPDYAGLILPDKDGAFSGPTVLIAYQLEGKRGSVSSVTGTHTDKKGDFKGTLLTATGAGGAITGTFSC